MTRLQLPYYKWYTSDTSGPESISPALFSAKLNVLLVVVLLAPRPQNMGP